MKKINLVLEFEDTRFDQWTEPSLALWLQETPILRELALYGVDASRLICGPETSGPDEGSQGDDVDVQAEHHEGLHAPKVAPPKGFVYQFYAKRTVLQTCRQDIEAGCVEEALQKLYAHEGSDWEAFEEEVCEQTLDNEFTLLGDETQTKNIMLTRSKYPKPWNE